MHVHGNLLFFESFVVLTEADAPETRPRFAGIEVVNLSATLTGSFVSALLVYPDTRVSAPRMHPHRLDRSQILHFHATGHRLLRNIRT